VLHRLGNAEEQAKREQEAKIGPQIRAAELQTQLNRMTADQHLEYLRSTQLIEANVQVTLSLPVLQVVAMHEARLKT